MKPFFSSLVLIIFLSLLRASTAAPLALDLGQGLAYHRAHTLPGDLPSASPAKPRPLVLDLRYATGDANAGTALAASLKFHAAPRSPIFLLANAATGPAIRSAFAARDDAAGLVVLGVASAGFTPDIDLPVDPAEERRAYDALENGTALAALIAPPLEKPRYDEAKLVAERLPARAPTPDPEPVVPAPSAPPPLIDAVLQRAVHLHRALLALKRIPSP